MRRPPRGRIPPRPDRTGLHSRFASGPRPAAPRLAGPIDSLVRVSRRVGRARDNRPRTRGAVAWPAPAGRPGAPPAATEDGRGGEEDSPSRRAARPADRPPPLNPARREPGGGERGRPGQARPVVPSSVGPPARPRPGCRLSRPTPPSEGRPGRRNPTRPASAGDCQARPVAGAAPGRSARRRARRLRTGPAGPPRAREGRAGSVPGPEGAAPAPLNLPGPICAALPFASRRLHVLLNSLFRVLFNFPSRYLCSIGLVQVFSLGWSLPPAFGLRYKTTRLPEALVRGRPAPAGA